MKNLSVFAAVLAVFSLYGKIVPSAIFSDNMVLQRDKANPVWGSAEPGEKITVQFAGQTKTVSAGKDGSWMLKLDQLQTSTQGREMKISSGDEIIVFKNILVGDLWLCGGQSNMEMNFEKRWALTNREQELKATANDLIRHVKIEHQMSSVPVENIRCSRWAVSAPENNEKLTAAGYFFAREIVRETGIPIGIIDNSWSASRIEPYIPYEAFIANRQYLGGFADKLENSFTDVPQGKKYQKTADGDTLNHATLRYNKMVHPLRHIPVKGVLWYQGCTNAYESRYHYLMKALVEGWRHAWGYEFPFYYVQLSTLDNHYSYFAYTGFASLREQQRKALKLIPNSAMVVTIDIGIPYDIHPKNKQDVGKRLAKIALARDYGKNIVYSGPTYREMKIEGRQIRIFLDNADGLRHAIKSGLNEPGAPRARIANFAIAGEDQNWWNADVTIDGNTLIISSKYVDKPVAVRHAFAGYTYFPISIYNGAGLPLEPFRTDDWGK